MTNITVRPVTANDHAAWLALWQAYLQFYKTELSETISLTTWQRLLDAHEPTHSALAWLGEKAVGMVNFIYHRSNWSIEHACYLQDLYVASEQRGLGIGRQLIQHVYQTASADGCTKVHWLTHETNAIAIDLYEQVAERSGFIQFRKGV
ncbi:acetyltransferase family protein [Pseudomonas putida S610]|uniref:GNAT family N-acetyltransferase n=1 Tax=Pseudomonas putida TaxID=303 RepID=UPI0003C572DC|nr:GNAT family N-acetyltransferase [Pseudomonas putida]EST17725.1 acetyltransferase family protein [Pseudomonas putida S610]